MIPPVSSIQPFIIQTQSSSCQWINDLCKAIHDIAMKFFNAICDFFSLRQNVPTPGGIVMSAHQPNPRNLLSFYRDLEANNNGVTLSQILNWDDGQLEALHNFIQWLFPLETFSGPNPTAPVLDRATIETFRNDVLLKNQLLRSLRRMLAFYGLQLQENGTGWLMSRASNFNARSAVWLTPCNHNFLRITRMIHSLKILGLQEHGDAFQALMLNIARQEGAGIVDENTIRYWRRA